MFVFGDKYDQLGFYSDDAGFLTGLKNLNGLQLLEQMKSYVPGRNLHILWQYIAFVITGNSVEDLPKLHLIQSFFDSLNVILFFIILRFSKLSVIPIFLGAIFFALFPNHAETHFWLSSLPMNIISTFFLLLQILMSVVLLSKNGNKKEAINKNFDFTCSILLLTNLFFLFCAVLTYDQVVPLCLFVTSLTTIGLLNKNQNKKVSIVYFFISFVIVIIPIVLKILKTYYIVQVGPTFQFLNLEHILLQSNHAWSLTVGSAFSQSVSSLSEYVDSSHLFESLFVLLFPLITLVSVTSRNYRNSKCLVGHTDIYLKKSHVISYYLILYLISFTVYWLAYLPSLLWFISPRHCYLPTLGLSMFVTISLSILFNAVNFIGFRFLKNIINITILTFTLYVIFYFTTLNLVEKQSWIDSYQMRYNLYNNLNFVNPTSDITNKKVLILQDFPQTMNFGSAPLWAHEQGSAFEIITKNKFLNFQSIENNSVSSSKGYYVYVNPWKYDLASLRHIYSNNLVYISLKSLFSFNHNNLYLQKLSKLLITAQNNISSKKLEKIDSKPYQITYELSSYKKNETGSRSETNSCIIQDRSLINLKFKLPEIKYLKNEIITLIAFTSVDGNILPISDVRPNGNPVLIPVEIPYKVNDPTTRVSVTFYHPITNLEKIELYATSERENRFLTKIDVLCDLQK